MKPLIDQAFWSDPDIEGSKAGVKLAALWLITNSQTNLIGICGASMGRFEFETGLKSEALTSALEALPRAFVKVGSVIFVRNYIRHQFGSGDKLKRNNFFVALKSLFLSIKDEALKSLVLQEYPEFEEALQRASQGLIEPKDGKEREGKKEGVQGKPKFERPTMKQVEEEMIERGLANARVESEQFINHFNSNGWRVGGKAPMIDWKAAVITWKHRAEKQRNGSNGSHSPKIMSLAEAREKQAQMDAEQERKANAAQP